MDLVFGNSYIMSNIDSHLCPKDIVRLQQTSTLLNDSLTYKSQTMRVMDQKVKFKNGLINCVLNAQTVRTPRSVLKIYTFLVKNPYGSCLLFRGCPAFFEKAMNDLEKFKNNAKYNKQAVRYFLKILPRIYANIPKY